MAQLSCCKLFWQYSPTSCCGSLISCLIKLFVLHWTCMLKAWMYPWSFGELCKPLQCLQTGCGWTYTDKKEYVNRTGGVIGNLVPVEIQSGGLNSPGNSVRGINYPDTSCWMLDNMFRVREFVPDTVSLPSAINLADEVAVNTSSQMHGCMQSNTWIV